VAAIHALLWLLNIDGCGQLNRGVWLLWGMQQS